MLAAITAIAIIEAVALVFALGLCRAARRGDALTRDLNAFYGSDL